MTEQFTQTNGSSPHTRGTPLAEHFADLGVRFIPACAGNARSTPWPMPGQTVHPRMRGERGFAPGIFASTIGSSPHARGTRQCGHRRPDLLRFIPACAGNASRLSRAPSCCTVHPRMRGERTGAARLNVIGGGSSPHARGTLVITRLEMPRLRFIPACAGNASKSSSTTTGMSVHPRMRGERTSSKLLIYRMKSEPSDSTKRSGC